MPEEVIPKAAEIDLKLVFADVLRGHTVIKNRHLGENEFYIKHLNLFDNIQTDKNYNEALEKAKKKNLPTERDQKKYLEEEGLWTKENEREVAELGPYISNLKVTKSKLFLLSQVKPIKKDIEEAERKLESLILERSELMGFTAERYAHKKSNEMYIQYAVYKDKEFKELALDDEKFNHLSDEQLSELTTDYNKATLYVTLDNLKRISLSPFFGNYFYLCDDNPQIFYGKPVINLTFFQAELFAYGRYFKSLAQDSKASPPDDISNDPDKLIEFYEMRKNADEVMQKIDEKAGDKSGATSLVGATKEDLKAIGVNSAGPQTVNLSKLAKEKGGTLSMDDFVDLHS
jgi:hypothetical protein